MAGLGVGLGELDHKQSSPRSCDSMRIRYRPCGTDAYPCTEVIHRPLNRQQALSPPYCYPVLAVVYFMNPSSTAVIHLNSPI